MAKNKFYVVWHGLSTGVYDSWTDCRLQVHGVEGAKYKGFPTRAEAEEAYAKGYAAYKAEAPKPKDYTKLKDSPVGIPNPDSIAVDAACSGNPGDMEYRGVYVRTGQELFRIGPMKRGTNNIGEFLALVHGLALLKQQNSPLPLYSDSRNAISWVKNKKCKTRLERTADNEPIFDLIARAEKWLNNNSYTTPILKWETTHWGEIPADFGRK